MEYNLYYNINIYEMHVSVENHATRVCTPLLHLKYKYFSHVIMYNYLQTHKLYIIYQWYHYMQ